MLLSTREFRENEPRQTSNVFMRVHRQTVDRKERRGCIL
jgi:hypothetical protein